jgi:RNA polymerase sigma factor (sigma-70 family)
MEKVPTAQSEELTPSSVTVLEALYRAEYPGMVRLAYTLVGSNAEAEEIVQDSFVEVHSRMCHIRKPGAYLRSAVVSRCRSTLRRRAMAAQRPPDRPASLPSEAGELWDVLGRLPEPQKLTVVLRHYGGYGASEIGELLDMPASTVRSHLRRGLSALRKELEA